jgi:peroxiredoxin
MKKLATCAFFMYSLLCLVSHAEGTDAGNINPVNPKAKPSLAAPIAPDFALKDLSGKTWVLKDYRGKVVFLYFTTTWCPYCKRDIPNLKRLYSSMKGKNFEFLAIYINESPQKVASFAAKYALPFPILLDSEASAARSYNVRGVPTKILVRKDGTIGCWQCINVEEGIQEFLKDV